MSKIEARGANSSDSADWNHAWEAVSRLAAARGTPLPKHKGTQSATDERKPAPSEPPPPAAPPPTADLSLPWPARDQLARDIAEIEHAAAALRRAEPSLKPRLPGRGARTELRDVRSVWILIALIWLCAASVVSCAIGAIFLLFR
jgi:hypothetical protein